jgi:hypothetical protein
MVVDKVSLMKKLNYCHFMICDGKPCTATVDLEKVSKIICIAESLIYIPNEEDIKNYCASARPDKCKRFKMAIKEK